MLTRTRHLKGGLTAKAFAVFVAFVLCVGFVPFVPAAAYADPGLVGGSPVFGAKSANDPVNGGAVIDRDGIFPLADNARGTITICENVTATIVGTSFADGSYQDVKYEGLYFVVENGASLTLENVCISNGANEKPAINFASSGSFNIEGTNIIDVIGGGGSTYGVVHAAGGSANTVTLGGSGTLFAYKDSGAALIGSNKDDNATDPCANIVFNSGTWNLKGNRTGAIVGNDMAESGYGTITINGGELQLKAVARGACLGGSASGYAADVVIKGGLIDCYSDFDGSAVGGAVAGKGVASAGFGTLTITGGSLKTMLGVNVASMSKAAYGFTDEEWVAASSNSTRAFVSEKAITAANDKALLVFDMSEYAGQGSAVVRVDGSSFYSGAPTYSYVINEPKSPQGLTSGNFLANTAASYVGDGNISGQAQGSSLAPDKNLYLWLSKENHTLAVGVDAYSATWDATAGAFSLAKKEKYGWYTTPAGASAYEIGTVGELAELAEIVNGTANGISQDNFAGKTVTLTADVDLSAIAWTPIGTAAAPFAGTFDGAGKAITGLSITGGTGYAGLFGNNAGTVKDFTLAGSVASSGDFVGAVAGFNSGTIQGVVSSAEISAGSAYNVGGIAGLSTSGTWVDSSGTTQQIAGATGLITECSTSGAVTGNTKVGGIVGENAGTVSKCSSSATVDGTNAGSKNGVGGIVGRNGNNNTAVEAGLVESCYFVGTVSRSGQKWTGGIAGLNNAKSSVANCYMAGTLVAGGAGNNNAIVGKQEGSATNNYALSGLPNTGNSETEVGIVKTADEMKTPLFVLQLNGGGSAFNVDSGNINGGLPCLAWEGGTPAAATDIPAIAAAVDAINAIGTPVTIDSKDQIEAAQAAYAAMTDEEKALLPANAQAAYDAALAAYGAALTAQVQDLVAAFPADVTTTEGMAAVENALAAYNALSADQKANVPSATLAALVSAQQVVANAKIEAAIAQANAAEQERQAAVASAAASQAQVTQLQSDLAQAKASQGKAINPMTVQAKTITVKVKKKKTTFNMSQAFTLKNAKGKVTFAKVAGNDKVSITNGGKVTVKKGLKKGKSYKISVLVCAAGNGSYCPAVKTVTLVVKAKK